jgi:general secretion pathway protein C
MAARWTAWGVWAALAASVVFWGLRLGVQGQPLPAEVRTVALDPSSRGDVLRLLAGPAAASRTEAPLPSAAASRFKLLGVMAGADARSASAGLALLSVDGKPARAVRVGAVVEGDWVVQQVTATRVKIGPRDGPVQVALDLSPLPAAATGRPGETTGPGGGDGPGAGARAHATGSAGGGRERARATASPAAGRGALTAAPDLPNRA